MSDLLPESEAEAATASPLAVPAVQRLEPRDADVGGLKIRRVLPVRDRRVIGPWCFFDRYGPFTFDERNPVDVAPHPHMGLQTVSWLVDGAILHQDGLGYEGLVRPGELNLMTAGRGIAHAEATPRTQPGTLNGVQLWVALPDAHRQTAPAFQHHVDLPALELRGGIAKIIIGGLGGVVSPARTYSPMVGAELTVHRGERLHLPLDAGFEHGVLVLGGDATLEGERLDGDTLYYLGTDRAEVELTSVGGGRVMLIGGARFDDPVLMWWNFVARTSEEIDDARRDWVEHRRFAEVSAYRGPRVEAPRFTARATRPPHDRGRRV